ncbi:MAG: rhodanese-like domain-containing protein [Deltaproteobacteria bacterium]
MGQTENLPLEIDCKSVKAKLDANADFLLVDCREVDEHQRVRIHQAKLVPMSAIQDSLGELEDYKHKEIVVHCHHGGRSLKVTHWLRSQGFANVKSMAGGIDLWAVEIDPKLPRY